VSPISTFSHFLYGTDSEKLASSRRDNPDDVQQVIGGFGYAIDIVGT